MMANVQSFLKREIYTLNGFQVTMGTVVIVLILYMAWRRMK